MNHSQIKLITETAGLAFSQIPADNQKDFQATNDAVRVLWSTSYEGSLLGNPRVYFKDTHRETFARNLLELQSMIAPDSM